MDENFPPVLRHDSIEEVFPDIFTVNGVIAMKPFFKFDRNMTIVRQGKELSLFNTLRLDDDGLARLDELGEVEHVFRLGFFHGRDDAFYKDRYQAKLWALPGHQHRPGCEADVEMTEDTELPITGAELFVFKTTAQPEALVKLDRDGGILIPCDSLQNWSAPNDKFNFAAKLMMRMMGFFKPTNVGPGWIRLARPKKQDFERLSQLSYKHVLPAHGTPVKDTAHEDYAATFKRLFDVDPA